MSLLSHLSRPWLLIGLAAIATAEEPAAAPPALAEWKYTNEQLAVEPVTILARQCALATKLEIEVLWPSVAHGQRQSPGEEMPEYRRESVLKQAAAWKEIDAVKGKVYFMSFDPETEAVARPAWEMYNATKSLSELHQQMIKIFDSGKPLDSSELKALAEKAKPIRTLQVERTQQAMNEVMRILDELERAKTAAAKAKPATESTPAPAPAKPAPVSPAPKQLDLPPGMTRTGK